MQGERSIFQQNYEDYLSFCFYLIDFLLEFHRKRFD